MNNHFVQIVDELEHQRTALIGRVRQLSPEQFNHSPAPGKWSINQILVHIIEAEQLSIAYMKKKKLGIDGLQNSGIAETLRLWLLIISQRIPVKYKAPKVVVENTKNASSVEEVDTRWQAVREELFSMLEGIEEKNIRKVIYKHPLAGRLNTRQALVFFREHIIHHMPQIKRLL
jgi:uncharacterized damage-inducible protein DinB